MKLSKWNTKAMFVFVCLILYFGCKHDNQNKEIGGGTQP